MQIACDELIDPLTELSRATKYFLQEAATTDELISATRSSVDAVLAAERFLISPEKEIFETYALYLSKDFVPDKLRSLRRRLEDATTRMNQLNETSLELKRLESSLAAATPKTNNKKAASTRPMAVRGGLNWKDAERLARDYMRHLGYTDARLTTAGRDGGIDIVSKSAVAQVKWHVSQVGSPDLQALFGIAAHEKKTAIFFAQRYSPDALRWANKTKMALFRFTPSGLIEPANPTARQL